MSRLGRKLARQRRDAARQPLVALLRWALVHAMQRLGDPMPATAESVAVILDEVRHQLGELANAGAFRYFGILDAYDLGHAPVTLASAHELGHELGTVMLELAPLVAWIFAAGGRGDGWLRPDELDAEDLAR